MAIEDEIAAIREAIASGAKRINFQDGTVRKEVEFPSFDDLKKRLDYLLGVQAGEQSRPRGNVLLATFGRG